MIRTKSDIVQTDMITRRAPLILAWEKEHSLIFSYDHLEADKAQVIALNPQKITKKKDTIGNSLCRPIFFYLYSNCAFHCPQTHLNHKFEK